MNKIDYRMCLAFRFKAFPVILSNSWNTHITYIIFKDIKKANKFLFSIHIKMTNNYYQKKQRKASKRSMWMISKSFWKRKRQKSHEKDIKKLVKEEKKHNKNLSEDQKKKLAEYRRNYNLTHSK